MSNRPDFSQYLVHFTSDRSPCGKNTEISIDGFLKMNAYEKLLSILSQKKIYASVMPWTGSQAVCFTECPWNSLIEHTSNYSPYGIGFEKNYVFSKNGGPVYYIRADEYNKQQEWHEHIKPFLTPFCPAYAPKKVKECLEGKICDFSHEREWRVPHDFPFEIKKISFIILNSYEDMAKFPKEFKDVIGRDNFILMENYKKIEQLWPVHLL